jgi:hypothetical protein
MCAGETSWACAGDGLSMMRHGWGHGVIREVEARCWSEYGSIRAGRALKIDIMAAFAHLALRSDGSGFLTFMRMWLSCSPIWYKSTGRWPFTSTTIPCCGIGSEMSSSTDPTKLIRTAQRTTRHDRTAKENQPSATTTRSAQNDSFCSAPYL